MIVKDNSYKAMDGLQLQKVRITLEYLFDSLKKKLIIVENKEPLPKDSIIYRIEIVPGCNSLDIYYFSKENCKRLEKSEISMKQIIFKKVKSFFYWKRN